MYKVLMFSSIGVLVILTSAACSGSGESGQSATTPAGESTEDHVALPEREGPRRETTGSVPHIQLDAALVPEVDAELLRRSLQLPGVEQRESARSLPGARGLWLGESIELARADVLGGSREFAHVHPDGSLHAWLPVERAIEVDRTKWGELHPWVDREGFWEGVVMIYTPETLDELEITISLLVDAYNFVTGGSRRPG